MNEHASHQKDFNRLSLFELILENAGDVLWSYEFKTDRYTYASPSVYQLRGFTPDEIVRQRLTEALTPESAAKARVLVRQRIKDLESNDMSARFGVDVFEQIKKDGSTVMTEVMTTFLTDTGGKVIGIVGIARDISKRLEEEQRRQALEKKLYENQKHESINRIVSGVAHELNNMLMPVSGYAELLNALFPDNEGATEYCQQICQSTQKATGLIDKLLDYTGSQQLKLKYVDLNHTIGDFSQFLRSIIKDNIIINLQHDGSCPWVKMDQEKLRQIIINLSFNAQDAMHDGGQLTLSICTILIDRKSANQFKLHEGKYAQLVISDTGTGIEPSVRPKIFDPFFTTKAFGMASGLGLSAVYGIVKQHEGHISVDSTLGQGTSVTIIFPLHENEPKMPIHEHIETGANIDHQKTIMLVEDDDDVRKLIKEMLTLQGHTVLHAHSSDDALEIAKQHTGQIDLLISDIIMPGMNGLQLSDELQKQYSAINTIFISGYSKDIINKKMPLPPNCRFLQKPFSLKEFNQLLKKLISKSH